ncbi:MAG: helical backbone metal receptor [Rhizobacter sp.]|nr:helical backbone metal receptor [Rhizobacter sp.]
MKLGRSHDKSAPRIASLVPSLTELAAALGLAPCLVARTGYCIHPKELLRQIPKVGGTKTVNLKKLRRLAPTHVLVNIDENRLETVQAIREWGTDGPQVIVTHPCGPQDNLVLVQQMVESFGRVDGVPDRAASLSRELSAGLALTRAGAWLPQKVLYLVWRDPWMTVATDTYLSRMLAEIGWTTLPDAPGGASGAGRYPVVHGVEPWLAQVQQVLLSSEPYSFGPGDFEAARALCPGARVRLVDGELLSWYGARAVAGLRYLRELGSSVLDR